MVPASCLIWEGFVYFKSWNFTVENGSYWECYSMGTFPNHLLTPWVQIQFAQLPFAHTTIPFPPRWTVTNRTVIPNKHYSLKLLLIRYFFNSNNNNNWYTTIYDKNLEKIEMQTVVFIGDDKFLRINLSQTTKTYMMTILE